MAFMPWDNKYFGGVLRTLTPISACGVASRFRRSRTFSLLPLMGFTGTIWQGVIPRRDRDQLLITYLVSSFSRNYADFVVAMGGKRPTAEYVLEVGYAVYINDYYTIQPDIQYVIRPNGKDAVKNSLVIGVQFVASF